MKMYSFLVLLILTAFSSFSQSREEGIRDFEKYRLTAENVVASGYESKAHGGFNDFFPHLVIDGNITNNSSWRAENDGQWIRLDLGSNVPVDHLQVAFMRSEQRSYRYAVEVQKDNSGKWKMIVPKTESLKVQGYQKVPFPPKTKCRYIRITGYGNSDPEFKNWFNINEVEVFYRLRKK